MLWIKSVLIVSGGSKDGNEEKQPVMSSEYSVSIALRHSSECGGIRPEVALPSVCCSPAPAWTKQPRCLLLWVRTSLRCWWWWWWWSWWWQSPESCSRWTQSMACHQTVGKWLVVAVHICMICCCPRNQFITRLWVAGR